MLFFFIFFIPGWRSSKGSGSALWYSSVSFSTSSEILKVAAHLQVTHQNTARETNSSLSEFKTNKESITTDLVRMLTSSCVLPCCSLSHCSSRAVSSALESTLADADAIEPVRMPCTSSLIHSSQLSLHLSATPEGCKKKKVRAACNAY